MTLIPTTATTSPKARAKRPSHRTYPLVVGGESVEWPSVTTCLSSINRPALVNWQIRTVQDAAIKAAGGLYESLSFSAALPADQFEAQLREWIGREREDEKVLRKAGDIGTNVHKYIQWYMHRSVGHWDDVKEPSLETPEAERAVAAFLGWWTKQETEPMLIEECVYNEEQQYAGTLDWMGYINSKIMLIDWKTAGGIYDEALLQNAAYAFAKPYNGTGCVRPDGGMIVRLPKKKGDEPDYQSPEWCRVLTVEDQEVYYGMFCHVRALYRFLEGI